MLQVVQKGCIQGVYKGSQDGPARRVGCPSANESVFRFREALIKSLSAFILGFLCNARNGTTRIASYLRSPMTKQCIKILIKAGSMNESVLP